MLTNQEVAKALVDAFADHVYNFDEPYELLTLTTSREQLLPVLEWLHRHERFQIQFLTDVAGVHFPEWEGSEFAVVYHLHSLVHNFRLRVKVFLSKDDLHIPSITSLYSAANWLERETFDFYGIIFDGHPDLRRILNMDEMDYFPMRKEYPLEDATRQDKIDALFGR